MTVQPVTSTSSEDTALEQAAALFKALSHPLRLKLVCGLMHEEKTQTQISRMLGIPTSSLAQHIAVLRRAGIIDGKRDNGAEIYLYVADERVMTLFDTVCTDRDHTLHFHW